MTRNIWGLCLSVLLVTALLLPIAGCIKLGKSPLQQPSANQTIPSGPSAPQPPSPQPPTPPANQSGPAAPTPPNPPANPSGIGVLQPNPPAPMAVANWTGTWQCGSTKVYLTQSGNMVTGWTDYQNGKLEGTATGNTLNGTWSMSPSLTGRIQLIMLADGKSFAGTYGAGSAISGSGTYSCTRINSAIPPGAPLPPSLPAPVAVADWTGTWQCGQIKMYFSQAGNQVTGWYDYQDGKLKGTATGNTFAGTWSESPSKTGDIQLTMSAEGKSFAGTYGGPSSGSWSNCARISSAMPPAGPATLGPPPVAPTTNWTGSWLCGQWGRLTLTQSGDQVTGSYTYENGKLTGYAAGNTLVGTWSEPPTYNPPNDAGDVQFNLSADGNSFTGHWRYGSAGDWKPWNGERDH